VATYEMTGTVKRVMDPQTFSSGFSKREFVVTTEGDRFPQDIKFECVKDKCALLDNVEAGQRVKVTFDLRGNEYNGRYYVNLTAWRIQAAESSADGVPEEIMPPEEEETSDSLPGDDETVVPF